MEEIRRAEAGDLERILAIYDRARKFMAETGNPRQWGPTHWPPESLARQDIREGRSRVYVKDGTVHGVFFFAVTDDPSYRLIEKGAWHDPSPYAVVHRIASSGEVHGVFRACLDWARNEMPHLRMDTHPDNKVMQHLLLSYGFSYCGIIHVPEDTDPRLAYELAPRMD